jgi:hypothetical protein
MVNEIIVIILGIIGIIGIVLVKRIQTIDNRLQTIQKQFIISDNPNWKPIHSSVNDIRKELCHDEIEIEVSPTKGEYVISNEEFQKLKDDILSLSSRPDNWNNRGSLPIEKSSILSSIRFLHLMDKYNYLSKSNSPSITGTPDGCVKFTFGSFPYPENFDIEFSPDGKYKYRCWCILDDIEPEIREQCKGSSNYQEEVLQILLGRFVLSKI